MPPPPRTPGRAVRDAAPVAAALALCPVAALLTPGDPSGPVSRGEDVVRIEQRLGVFVEPDLHAWASGHGTLLAAACIFYVWAHLPLAIGPLVWAWLERPKAFAAARDTFVLAQVLTVAAYLLVPTAPPRLLPHLGFHDTLAGFWGASAAGASHVMQSPYAAVPSGHVVFALVAAVTVVALARPLAVRVLAALYPAVVVGVTVITANHFLLDAAAAALVAAVSAGVVLGLAPRLARGVVATPRRA